MKILHRIHKFIMKISEGKNDSTIGSPFKIYFPINP